MGVSVKEFDVILDAYGAGLSPALIDSVISAVFEQNKGEYPVSTFSIISHPRQADSFRALLGQMDEEYRNNSYVLATNPTLRVRQWIETLELSGDSLVVESPKARGVIIHLL